MTLCVIRTMAEEHMGCWGTREVASHRTLVSWLKSSQERWREREEKKERERREGGKMKAENTL